MVTDGRSHSCEILMCRKRMKRCERSQAYKCKTLLSKLEIFITISSVMSLLWMFLPWKTHDRQTNDLHYTWLNIFYDSERHAKRWRLLHYFTLFLIKFHINLFSIDALLDQVYWGHFTWLWGVQGMDRKSGRDRFHIYCEPVSSISVHTTDWEISLWHLILFSAITNKSVKSSMKTKKRKESTNCSCLHTFCSTGNL